MAGHDTARLSGVAESRAGLSTPENRVARSTLSFETGQSNTSDGSRRPDGVTLPDASSDGSPGRPDRHKPQQTGPSPAQAGDKMATDALQTESTSTRRKRKSRSSGGFLLQNPFSGKLRPATRGSIRSLFHINGKASTPAHTPPQPSPSSGESSLLQSSSPANRIAHDETSTPPQSRAGRTEGSAQGGGGSRGASEEPVTQKLPQSSEDSTGDVDSTQIVQMALSLSESRRMVSRRHVSRATPPRLSPLSDGSSGSDLRQHLQQQRKASSSAGVKIQHGPSPRLPSAGRLDSPLQAAVGLESALDGPYRYQFSSSTLARAAKAKEHLELMAQYRRLLDVLPPLKAGFGPHLTTSPPGSPSGNKLVLLGRQYNPLQFIRNRKVRARERKVIDAEKQGFGDVEFVKLWVDRVVERATSFARHSDDEYGGIMPKFLYADDSDTAEQQAPMDQLSKVSTRVRRPRVDWFVDPCDITADAYWLEQDNHKELIEDRHWRKIFPPAVTLSRPISRESTAGFDAIPAFSMQDDDPSDSQSPGIFKVDSGLSQNSAKHRAKQTLHSIRAFPHRHHGHNMPSDLMWHKKDSTSDISGSEGDRRRQPNTTSAQGLEVGASSNNLSRILTEEQLSDTAAKDARRQDHVSGARSEPESAQFVSSASRKLPERNPLSLPPSRLHSRKGSTADTSESDRKPAIEKLALGSPVRHVPGRQSLDVPDGSRKDFSGYNYSLPASPELRPTRESTDTMVVGARLSSSWSRSGSPTRNPISKFKQIIRDKGGNYSRFGGDQEDYPKREYVLEPGSPEKSDPREDRQATDVEQVQSEPLKARLALGSTLLRPDDVAGRRGIFKAGPRLETAFRGGVSRLGDMLWKREGLVGEPSPYMETTDESDNEKDGGRAKPSVKQQFLDTMPLSHHVHGNAYHSFSANASKTDLALGSASNGQQSVQSDGLRPLRNHGRSASTSALVETWQAKADGSSDVVDPSRQGSSGAPDDVRDADKRHMARLPVSRPDGDVASTRSRHWSVADVQGTPAEDAPLTRREIARMRALILSTAIKAMEISRRAQEAQRPFCADALPSTGAGAGAGPAAASSASSLNWAEIARLCPEAAQPSGAGQGNHVQVAFYELYALAGRVLSAAIQSSGRRWQASADQFTYRTSPQLQNRIGDVRSRIADDLSEQSRQASDLADETNRDLALNQPLRVNAVVDSIGKMLRRRRRRLRWIRRALWLTVEWLLVGLMWYVWAIVMFLRVFLGIGKGVVRSVRWLFWL
ncbi:hypothetical protein E4U42_005295 [Claviceps africana]|uniref:Uncharacterized protein n=1 Tax=Claviceps africana TaxID=83212 RepID=A0A8K0JCC0_9HYPO|nr:hypothetical protein E4U42_005295 [Claviceps africana]